ncbi:phytoene/squalene synthase family protein [Tuwongella immobilis]|uniref:Phytoene synthase n=1 Tax=Tuwongella immobilis TaxID=692036 RepID=A0A6C2YNV4_9BACT|nr:phytoene/squalene synthase family protein [Tuwongella immobilis]VIP02735.1 phytoene synthase : Phytoene synthase OS=Haliangium ochraceum (strain DSM 14365 / JCM 11303 / SMP-2) GN=Hoch_2212 PE=4 SV=1: SQS_PSY [Tuwongella immobilis]VTS02295.1 phytoene synthase : Phytoene synthase OS=Haliangium ochraceum (strain DSM 14365 / JCM 11303 / SMP-2) GN=Hoch_2212 PE=4 SV=1: SQS_PSY [Tuwongella immobilis]
MNDRQTIQKHSKSFSLAAALLPAAARRRAEALYAWCRMVDDSVDLAEDPRQAAAFLEQLRDDIERIQQQHPPTIAAGERLLQIVQECQLPLEYPLELVRGMEMDVLGHSYQTVDDLLRYSYRVAGVVGCMMCHALEITREQALLHASHLGIAMQLTNIARDVQEDWQRGRLYLPAEWLPELPQPGSPLSDDCVAPAIQKCLELADRYYASGDAGLKHLAARNRIAIDVASQVYRAIGERISAHGYRASQGRAVVPARTKFRIALWTIAKRIPELLQPPMETRLPKTIGKFVPISASSSFHPWRTTMTNSHDNWRETASSVCYAISLTAILAATLFVMVALNPKSAAYDVLPWLYSGICIMLAPGFYVLSRRFDRQNQLIAANESQRDA